MPSDWIYINRSEPAYYVGEFHISMHAPWGTERFYYLLNFLLVLEELWSQFILFNGKEA